MALVFQFLLGLVRRQGREAEARLNLGLDPVSGVEASAALAAWWEGAHRACRAQSHCLSVFLENNVKSPSKGTHQTVRGLCSQNVTEYKNSSVLMLCHCKANRKHFYYNLKELLFYSTYYFALYYI